MGKLATSPLPYRGAPPLQSGGQNQKWPTSGQIGYLTPAVSGSPTATRAGGKIRSGPQVGKLATSPLPYRGAPPPPERGAKSEVAHKWANWLPHPCRIGEPHRFRAGGKIRSGPLMGKVATSPLPYRGAPPPPERGAKSEVAHKWASWLPHPCRIGEPHRHQSGGQNQKWPTSGQIGYLTPAVSGSPTATRAGGKIRSGPQVGKVATSPLPYRGAPPLQSGGQNQKWPTSGQIGYLTPAVSGSPTATKAGGKIRSGPLMGKVATSPLPYRGAPPPPERGAKSEVAHKWANWLPHPCRIGEPHRHQSGGQNQKWPTSGQIGYLTRAVSGSPTATRAGGKIRSGPLMGKVATSPLPYRGAPPPPERGAKSEVAHKWANWLPHPCRIGEPHRHQSGGQNQKWPTSGQIGYLTPAVSGSPTATRAGGKIRSGPQVGKVATSPLPYRGAPPPPERGAKSEVAHKWANWLPHPCRIGEPHRHQSGGQNQKWPTSGQIGYLTRAVSGSPTATRAGGKIRSGPQVGKLATSPLPYRGAPPPPERGAKSEVAHKWAKWLPHPCRIGEPHRFRAGGKIRSGPQVGKLATSPLPYRGAPPPPKRGAKSEVAHLWAKWLPHPCRIGEPHRHQSGGQNQKWPTSGQIGYLTRAVSGSPTATRAGGKIRSGPQVGKLATSPVPYRGAPPPPERGAKSEVAHLWAKWLPHPCRIGEPHRHQSGGQNQKWPTSGQIGYLTPAVSGSPTATKAGGKIRSGPLMGKVATSPLPYRGAPPPPERGAKSEVAHKWANWLPHPCRIGEPHRHQSGGQNQKWPTYGQIGYLTPAVSAKSEVVPKRGPGG